MPNNLKLGALYYQQCECEKLDVLMGKNSPICRICHTPYKLNKDDNMPNEKHTPLPWRYDDGTLRGPKGEFISDFYMTNSLEYSGQDNAAFIVKAINNHDRLLEALKEALVTLTQVKKILGADHPSTILKIEEAIRLAVAEEGK